MNIDNNWVILATGNGVVLQKHAGSLSLVYSATPPTGSEDQFSVNQSEPIVLPTVAGKNIYVSSHAGFASITTEELL